MLFVSLTWAERYALTSFRCNGLLVTLAYVLGFVCCDLPGEMASTMNRSGFLLVISRDEMFFRWELIPEKGHSRVLAQ